MAVSVFFDLVAMIDTGTNDFFIHFNIAAYDPAGTVLFSIPDFIHGEAMNYSI